MVVYEKWSHVEARLYTPKWGEASPPLENRLFPAVWHFLAAKYYCFYRVQDRRSQIWFLVPHSARWMGIRLDFVCTLFVACATFTGVFTTTDAGTVFACYFNQKQQLATTLCYFLFKKMEKNFYPRHSTLDRLARRGMIRRFPFVYLSRILYNRKETILKIEDELNELTHGHYEILILKKTFLSVWPF